MTRQLFVDMDRVLADFGAHHEAVFGLPCKVTDKVDWKAIRAIPAFFETMPPMPDLDLLWGHIERYSPIVLTAVPYSNAEAPEHKRAWARKHLGGHVEVRCCRSSEKCLHAAPGDILIDDWDKYRHLWLKAGGTWITHTSAEHTIEQLAMLGL